MRITLAYNLKREHDETQAELLSKEDVERLRGALRQLGHEVTPVEVSGPSDRVIDLLLDSRPDHGIRLADRRSMEVRAGESRPPCRDCGISIGRFPPGPGGIGTSSRTRKAKDRFSPLSLSFVSDEHVNLLYEAVVEATEEAVLNAMFCSGGMSGRLNRFAPPIPADTVREILSGSNTRKVEDSWSKNQPGKV